MPFASLKLQLFPCLRSYVFSTLGISVGTFIKPGFGTVLGAALGDIFSIMLLEPQPPEPRESSH